MNSLAICDTAGKVLDALGGNAEAGRMTASSDQAVSNWRRANRLPSTKMLVILAALRKVGKTAPPDLFSVEPIDEPVTIEPLSVPGAPS